MTFGDRTVACEIREGPPRNVLRVLRSTWPSIESGGGASDDAALVGAHGAVGLAVLIDPSSLFEVGEHA